MKAQCVCVYRRGHFVHCPSGCFLRVYNVSIHLYDARFASFCLHVVGRGRISCWLLHQCLFCCNKAWFRVDQSTPGIAPRPSFPLQPVEMRSLHNIYPENNDVWFDSLLGVSLWGLFSPTAATKRENRQKQLRPQKKGKQKKEEKNSNHCLWMMLGWCISVLGLHNEVLPFRCADSVSHSRFLRLLHFTKMLLTN